MRNSGRSGRVVQRRNFGTQSGSVQLTPLTAGRQTVSGTISTPSGQPAGSFSGTLSGAALTGTIHGNFYEYNGTYLAGQTAGTFSLAGGMPHATGNFRACCNIANLAP